jgi:hypothetical protein
MLAFAGLLFCAGASAAKAGVNFAAVTARLKPRPFKAGFSLRPGQRLKARSGMRMLRYA